MKKHKSVVAILLAVMMIFTMMPAMAFAAIDGDTPSADYKFSDDLSTIVTSSGVRYVGTVKVWDAAHGKVKVQWDANENGSIADPGITFEYYDLAGAEFLVDTATGTKAIAKSYDQLATSQFTKLKVKKPADVAKVNATDSETAEVAISDIAGIATGWSGTVIMTVDGKKATSVEQKDAVQNVEITLDQSWAAANNKKVVNAPAAATTVINAKKATAKSAVFFFDEVSEKATKLSTTAAANTVPYDGAEHTIVMKPMDGYSVSYTVFNKKTGTEDAVSAVTLKDVLAESMTVTATVTDTATAGKTEKETYTFKGVNITSVAKPSLAWAARTDMPYTIADNQEYDPYAYLVVKAGADTDEAKAAAKANEELLKGFFKDYYGITTETQAVKDPQTGNTVVKFVVGDYSVKKAEDVDAKYAAMLADFGITDPVTQKFTVPGNTSIQLAPADEFFEIEFINSPTSKSYKAKVLKKKAKSFKVKAEATNGDAITYKLINAPEKIKINKKTGKITLKKGLKKGTYKITVKAYVAKSYSWSGGYPCEYHNITIKVKK
jgi:hypothetical protein